MLQHGVLVFALCRVFIQELRSPLRATRSLYPGSLYPRACVPATFELCGLGLASGLIRIRILISSLGLGNILDHIFVVGSVAPLSFSGSELWN